MGKWKVSPDLKSDILTKTSDFLVIIFMLLQRTRLYSLYAQAWHISTTSEKSSQQFLQVPYNMSSKGDTFYYQIFSSPVSSIKAMNPSAFDSKGTHLKMWASESEHYKMSEGEKKKLLKSIITSIKKY